MKKNCFFSLLGCACGLLAFSAANAQTGFDFGNIDFLLTDNALDDAAKRYASVTLTSEPERAGRLGFTSANAKLNDRSPRAQAAQLAALRAVRNALDEISAKQLSPSKRADLTLLKESMDDDIFALQQHRAESDPLYYAEALDAVYDVVLKPASSPRRQRADLTARLNDLKNVADQAEKNLVNPSAFLARLAMEKTYYAYISFDELVNILVQDAEDDIAAAQIKNQANEAKRSIKRMFDLFKEQSQQESAADFRLGKEAYAEILKNRYQTTEPLAKLEKRFAQDFLSAQKQLAKALEPFAQDVSANEDEVTVIDGLNNQPIVEEQKKEPAKKEKKAKKGKFVPPTAQDFYTVAKRITQAPEQTDLPALLTQEANQLAALLTDNGLLPAGQVAFTVKPLPQYYAYTQSDLFLPPFGNNARSDFFIRQPFGNRRAQAEQLVRDYNTPTRKLLTAQELVPGRFYQTAKTAGLSAARRFYPAQSMADGWNEYALKLASEAGYIVTDDELLFLAWHNYRRAAAALVDMRLQSRQYSYNDAMDFLVGENGFTQEDAEALIKESALNPGKAVGYAAGLDALESARAKYTKKLGKKFSLADFHTKVLKAGNVSPNELADELERLYK
ncbi:DUF885 family protein [Candidatus Avelusimicrobium fimicolum]|uniref:DUF885 family protein n=1 Tax=Candidatus Avelusimicrobium fimicolum TaxID=3416216 RepID=UPI003D0EC517